MTVATSMLSEASPWVHHKVSSMHENLSGQRSTGTVSTHMWSTDWSLQAPLHVSAFVGAPLQCTVTRPSTTCIQYQDDDAELCDEQFIKATMGFSGRQLSSRTQGAKVILRRFVAWMSQRNSTDGEPLAAYSLCLQASGLAPSTVISRLRLCSAYLGGDTSGLRAACADLRKLVARVRRLTRLPAVLDAHGSFLPAQVLHRVKNACVSAISRISAQKLDQHSGVPCRLGRSACPSCRAGITAMKAVLLFSLLQLGCRRAPILRLTLVAGARAAPGTSSDNRRGAPVLKIGADGQGVVYFAADKVHTRVTATSTRLSKLHTDLLVWVAAGVGSDAQVAWRSPVWPVEDVVQLASGASGAIIFPRHATCGPSFQAAALGLNITDHGLRGVHRANIMSQEIAAGLPSERAAYLRNVVSIRAANHGHVTEATHYMDRSRGELRLPVDKLLQPHTFSGLCSHVLLPREYRRMLQYLKAPRVLRPRMARRSPLQQTVSSPAPRRRVLMQVRKDVTQLNLSELKAAVVDGLAPAASLVRLAPAGLRPAAAAFVRRQARQRGRSAYLGTLWGSDSESISEMFRVCFSCCTASLTDAYTSVFVVLGCPPLQYCALLKPSDLSIHESGVLAVSTVRAYVMHGWASELRLSPSMGRVLLGALCCILGHTNSCALDPTVISKHVRARLGAEGIVAIRRTVLRWASNCDPVYLQHVCLANGWLGGSLSQVLETGGCYQQGCG